MQKALEWVKNNQNEIVENIKEFLRIPSISADPAFKDDILKAANWVKSNFERIGLESRLIETKGYPVVFAQTRIDPSKPTVLVYFHYDVQPAGDESLWKTPAFEPTIIEDRIYGRGTNDNKMAGLMPAVALEAIIKSGEEPPVNFKFCIEGEEEVGSTHIGKTLEENRELFACDYIIISDGTNLGPNTPGIEVGARGLIYTEIKVTIGKKEMHSGEFGGIVKNANFELIKILSTLKDENGKINIPGIYDDLILPSDAELESWKEIPITEEDHLNNSLAFGLDEGEKGYSLLERNWSRPSLDINGMFGGYTGEGAKAVIPHQAAAKVSIRIAPNQDPKKVLDLFKNYIKSFETESVKIEIIEHSSASPFLTSSTDRVFSKLQETFLEVFGTKAYYIRTGGTIGLLSDMQRIFNKPILFISSRSPDEDLHAPNEFLRLKNFWRAIEVNLRLYSKI